MAETMVCAGGEGELRAQPIPDHLREKMQPYVAQADTKPLALRA
jgi:hypothetical protein